jgi:hypothetical protein
MGKRNFTITAPVLQYTTAAVALWLLKVPRLVVPAAVLAGP